MHRSTLFVALLFATAQASATEPSKKDVAAFAARTLDANCDKASPGGGTAGAWRRSALPRRLRQRQP